MKVLTFLPRFALQKRVFKALNSAQFVVETVLSAKECLQFAQFAQYEGVLVDSSFEGLTNVVDVYISALRSKVDRDFPQKLIRTNRGIGYTFTCVGALTSSATRGFGERGKNCSCLLICTPMTPWPKTCRAIGLADVRGKVRCLGRFVSATCIEERSAPWQELV